MTVINLPSAGVEPIWHAAGDDVCGYRIRGAAPGPVALAVGRRDAAGESFHRLAQLSSLPWLRGELVLVFEDALDDPASGLTRDDVCARIIDGAVYINFDPTAIAGRAKRAKARREVYWTVLRLMTRLGMIAGRGVPDAAMDVLPRRCA